MRASRIGTETPRNKHIWGPGFCRARRGSPETLVKLEGGRIANPDAPLFVFSAALFHKLQRGLGALHVLLDRTTADAYRSDDVTVDLDWIAAAERSHARAR